MIYAALPGVTFGIIASLFAAICFGAGDFFAGLLSRKHSPTDFFAAIYLCEIPILFLIILPTGEFGKVGTNSYLFLLGILGTSAFFLLLHGLAKGFVSVVMSLLGLLSLLVPAIVSVLIDDKSSVLIWLGAICASIAIICISYLKDETKENAEHKAKLKLSIFFGGAAGLLTGCYFTGLGSVHSPILIKLLMMQLPGFLWAIFYIAKKESTRKFFKRYFFFLVGIAFLYNSAQGVYPYAAKQIGLNAANIIINLYPGITILLAIAFLKEKTTRIQNFGFAVAAIGVVLVSIGTTTS
ncbi:MAG: EamA family transporter [Acidimicrobiia bacterium]